MFSLSNCLSLPGWKYGLITKKRDLKNSIKNMTGLKWRL